MKPSNESALVKACLQYLHLRGVFAWRQNQGAMRGEYKGKSRFVRFAGAKGISDIIGLLPESGKLIAIEAKIKPNKPTPDQEDFLAMVKAKGGVACVVYDLQELIDAMEAIVGSN